MSLLILTTKLPPGPTEYFFPKYWPEADIVVLGYKEPTYKFKFGKFDSMGEDKGPDLICKQLYEYFSNSGGNYFMMGVDEAEGWLEYQIEDEDGNIDR